MAVPKSSTGRSPAFQFYPDDFLADANVIVMSMPERGVYITLLCICWQQGSLPTDAQMLARLCVTPLAAFKKLWPPVERCFRVKGERLVHPRLEHERRKQADYRAKQAENGKKGGRPNKPTGSYEETHGKGLGYSGETQTEPKKSSPISDLQSSSLSSDFSQKIPASFTDARSKRPIFKGTRFVVFEWQLDDLRRLLGSHVNAFDLHAWFYELNDRAEAANIVVPQRDGGKWLQEQTTEEAVRRGLPVAVASTGQGKTAGNVAAAARFVARGQQ